MRFGRVETEEAEGAVLAHAVQAGPLRLPKARKLTRDDLRQLAEAGISHVVAAVLEPGDVGEDEAATRLAALLAAPRVEAKAASTGRVNLHAAEAGVFRVDTAAVDAFNAVDPTITLATLPDFASVEAGQMVATVKIIPFAVGEAAMAKAAAALKGKPVLTLHVFRPLRVALVQTMLPGTKASVLDKTAELTERRLRRSGGEVVAETRISHDEATLAEHLKRLAGSADLLIAFGASAVADDGDVIPAAIRSAGGRVERTGMPVDPGNLLVLGELAGRPVLGAPGCARSPKLNGFDWVLDRIAAGIEVDSAAMGRLGVGGLLMEIPTRPQPREPRLTRKLAVAGILLAAGRSSRMGGPNKLLARFDGVPLARRSAERLAASEARPVVAVLGHNAAAVRDAIGDADVGRVDNPDFASGLAGSLKSGVAALGRLPDGVLVALADMPGVETADYDRMIAAFRAHGGKAVVRATAGGRRGNPVILPAALAARVDELEGDTGARHLIETGGLEIIDVEIGEAARIDVDTPEALAAAGGEIAL
ncbi:MAG: molybdopterin-binding/glycosyltransferase family 2 protein [Rhizobiaceae bacterium]|nr:molybdopterin-binding/glycosyltransferase family 2 protein [Rhizobiaceae bacterium]